jgi:invasion protein IalB
MDEIMSPTIRHHVGLHHSGFLCPAGLALRTIIAASAVLAAAVLFTAAGTARAQTRPASPKSAASQKSPVTQGAAVPSVPAEPTLLAMFGEWGAYTAAPGGKKVCFALAKPVSSSTAPPNRPREQPWMFISTRPGEKVTNEISVTFGYPLKPGSDSAMDIAGNSYALNTQGDGAWVKNPAEEPRLVEMLRKGADVTVKGTSARGTISTDVYSLKGLTQALDRVGLECR